MNVSTWRHIAIAMSRRLLSDKGFERDYDDHIQQKADYQAGHSSLIAGNIYGRLLGAAPGHVQAAQIAYRDISRKWHTCLGFGVFLPPKTQNTGSNTACGFPLHGISHNKLRPASRGCDHPSLPAHALGPVTTAGLWAGERATMKELNRGPCKSASFQSLMGC